MNAVLDEAEQRCREVDAYRSEFLRYAAMADLTQPCPIGRMVSDYRLRDGTRRETIAETLADALTDSKEMDLAMALLAKAAKGEDIQAEACDLILRAASKWADLKSEM